MDMPAPDFAEAAAPARIPVNSHNEWDPLEDVIVGRLEGAVIPSNHPVVTSNIPGLAARPRRWSRVFIIRASSSNPRGASSTASSRCCNRWASSCGDQTRRTIASASARRDGRRAAFATPVRATACW